MEEALSVLRDCACRFEAVAGCAPSSKPYFDERAGCVPGADRVATAALMDELRAMAPPALSLLAPCLGELAPLGYGAASVVELWLGSPAFEVGARDAAAPLAVDPVDAAWVADRLKAT